MERRAKKAKLELVDVKHIVNNAMNGGNGGDGKADSLEVEDVEDNQIQSSLPLYLDHIFGKLVGYSQSQAEGLSPRYDPPLVHSNSQVVSVLESQGFLVEESTIAGNECMEASGCPLSIRPALLVGGICKPVSPNTVIASQSSSSPLPVGCGSQSSEVLFSPLENSISHQRDENGSNNSTNISTGHLPCDVAKLGHKESGVKLQCHSTEQETLPCVINKRKRKQSKTKSVTNFEEYHCPPSCTALAWCVASEKIVDMLAVVVQVNSAMEVTCRRSPTAGQVVHMSSLLLSDPTKSYFKLSLWREAAAWAERIAIGDIVYFKSIKLKVWKDEVVGTTMMRSSVLNLHQPDKKLPAKVQQVIPDKSMTDMMKWGKQHYGYLFERGSIPKSQREVKFRTSQELMGDSLVHFRGKLLCFISSRVALLMDQPGIEVHFHLLGTAASQCHSQLSDGVGNVWELMYVAVASEGTQTQNNVHILQATSRTHLRSLDRSCKMACEILKGVASGGISGVNSVVSGSSIADIISNRRSGMFKIEARADSMEFVLPDASRLSIKDMLTLLPPDMVSKFCQVVYVGCEVCSRALPQDDNGVYCQCMPCIMKLPGGYPSLSYFFRPLLVTLTDSSLTSITFTASQLIIPKVLGLTGKDVVQASLSKNEAKIPVQRMRQLFISADWVIKCLVTKDENSFVEELSFNILDANITYN